MAAKKDPEVEETAEFVVVVQVAGFRNGEPWPAAGEVFVLPIAEGEHYASLGYVTTK